MKDLSLIIWLTQLGLSVVGPLGCSALIAIWLRQQFNLGEWVIWVGILFGTFCAFEGLRSSLKLMSRLSKRDKKKDPPPISFNDHT